MKSKKETESFLAYRSFHMPVNTISKFASAGYDTVCVFPAHTRNSRGTPYSQYDPTWLWYDKIDFSPFDKMIEDISEAMPGARFLCMIDLNSPCWLEHMNAYSCADSFNNLGKAVHNQDWLQATTDYLRTFMKYADEKYGDRVAAYVLACGATDEWYDYSDGTDNAERRRAWREWRMKKGRPDPVDIPPQSVRDRASFEDFLRDPESDGLAMEYWHFCNESIADTILHFAKEAREVVKDRAQIGCFYGYILEKTDHTLVSCGHLEYERVLDSPDIDFLISPGTYRDRPMGGGSGFLIPEGSASVRGKRLLHECDQRTHTSNHFLLPYITLEMPSAWKNERETVAGIKREASLGMINGTHLWWFDMWGDFYQGEAVMDTLAQVRTLWDTYHTDNLSDMSEIAMIVDPESTYMVNQNHPAVKEMNLGTRNKLNRVGAPFDVYSFRDIPKIKDFSRYKLVIFTSLFDISGEKAEIMNQYVLCNDRYVLWMYAPGIYDGTAFAPDHCRKLTGIPYGSEGLSVKKMNGWTSAYLYDYSQLTVEMLKYLAGESGVRITTQEQLPVYARGDMLAVHTAEGKDIKLHVDPKYKSVKELFTGWICSVKEGIFIYPFASPDTALFALSCREDAFEAEENAGTCGERTEKTGKPRRFLQSQADPIDSPVPAE